MVEYIVLFSPVLGKYIYYQDLIVYIILIHLNLLHK